MSPPRLVGVDTIRPEVSRFRLGKGLLKPDKMITYFASNVINRLRYLTVPLKNGPMLIEVEGRGGGGGGRRNFTRHSLWLRQQLAIGAGSRYEAFFPVKIFTMYNEQQDKATW